MIFFVYKSRNAIFVIYYIANTQSRNRLKKHHAPGAPVHHKKKHGDSGLLSGNDTSLTCDHDRSVQELAAAAVSTLRNNKVQPQSNLELVSVPEGKADSQKEIATSGPEATVANLSDEQMNAQIASFSQKWVSQKKMASAKVSSKMINFISTKLTPLKALTLDDDDMEGYQQIAILEAGGALNEGETTNT